MRILPLIFFILLLVGTYSFQQEPCGGRDRWDVKNLTDESIGKVNLKPITTTVDSLRKIKPEKKVGDNMGRFGIEFNTYEINCKIREYVKEDDGDYHLVLMDLSDTSKTMIGEIPDPSCPSVAKSKHVKKFSSTRKYFEDNVRLKGRKVKYGIYKIRGVAFYDQPHKQLGVAPNAIELHPIIKMTKL